MHRIDNVTAAASLPTPASAGTAGYFSNATPGSGTPTIVDNDWCNDIQEELISILTAASVAPSKTTHNQVLTALEDLFPLKSGVLLAANNLSDLGTLATALTNLGFAKSISTNGYQKLPGGLIIQWGQASVNAASLTVTLPLTFPNANLIAGAFDSGSGAYSGGCAATSASTIKPKQ